MIKFRGGTLGLRDASAGSFLPWDAFEVGSGAWCRTTTSRFKGGRPDR
jgi:hypothetical protein